MQDLEAMAAKLLETARKLPSGQDRHNALQEIERFRPRITALQRLSGKLTALELTKALAFADESNY